MNFNNVCQLTATVILFIFVTTITKVSCQEAVTSVFSSVERDPLLDTTTKKARFLFEFNKEFDPPAYTWVPPGLTFTCKERAPGYYADPQAKCQAYHLCMPDGRRYTMLCGIGTVFNQRTFVCDHWYNYQCANVESDYQLNNDLWEDVLLPHSGYRSPKSQKNRLEEGEDETGAQDEEK